MWLYVCGFHHVSFVLLPSSSYYLYMYVHTCTCTCTCIVYAATPLIKRKLILLEDLAASVAHEWPRSKSLVYKNLSPSVEFIISLFPVYLHQADVLDLLISFFLTLFDSLKSQVSYEYHFLTKLFFVTVSSLKLHHCIWHPSTHRLGQTWLRGLPRPSWHYWPGREWKRHFHRSPATEEKL